MTIKIKDIVGALVEKKRQKVIDEILKIWVHAYENSPAADWVIMGRIADYIIDAQGEVRLGLNKERLAKLLYELATNNKWEELGDEPYQGGQSKEYHLNKADAIIAHEGEIIEVRK